MFMILVEKGCLDKELKSLKILMVFFVGLMDSNRFCWLDNGS